MLSLVGLVRVWGVAREVGRGGVGQRPEWVPQKEEL